MDLGIVTLDYHITWYFSHFPSPFSAFLSTQCYRLIFQSSPRTREILKEDRFFLAPGCRECCCFWDVLLASPHRTRNRCAQTGTC